MNADPKESLGIFPGFLCTTKGFRSLPSVCHENEYRVMFCILYVYRTILYIIYRVHNCHVSFDNLSFGITNNSLTIVILRTQSQKSVRAKFPSSGTRKCPKHVFDVFDSYIQVQYASHVSKPILILIPWEKLPPSWCPEKYCIKSSKNFLSIKHNCKRLSASRAIDSVQQPASYWLATLQLMHAEGGFIRWKLTLIWIDFGKRLGSFDRICRVSESTTASAWRGAWPWVALAPVLKKPFHDFAQALSSGIWTLQIAAKIEQLLEEFGSKKWFHFWGADPSTSPTESERHCTTSGISGCAGTLASKTPKVDSERWKNLRFGAAIPASS